MKSLNEKFGEPAELVLKKIQPFMNEMVRDFIAEAPFSVLATANADGHCDASPRGGTPGLFKVLDEKRILLPDIAGNKLFQKGYCTPPNIDFSDFFFCQIHDYHIFWHKKTPVPQKN